MQVRTIRLHGEVIGIAKVGDVDSITVGVHPYDFPVVTNEMTFQIPHEDGNEELFRTDVHLVAVFGDDGEKRSDEVMIG